MFLHINAKSYVNSRQWPYWDSNTGSANKSQHCWPPSRAESKIWQFGAWGHRQRHSPSCAASLVVIVIVRLVKSYCFVVFWVLQLSTLSLRKMSGPNIDQSLRHYIIIAAVVFSDLMLPVFLFAVLVALPRSCFCFRGPMTLRVLRAGPRSIVRGAYWACVSSGFCGCFATWNKIYCHD